ncbi:hypothetical protein FRC02_008974 [Tulasnella sp. 418]|nr:hypothetical protein FRC02_008974 [Tulasnella sp. 418]
MLETIKERAGKRRALLYYFDNAEKLKSCSTQLDWAMQEFQVVSQVDLCLKDLERHEELLKGQEELRDELRGGQTELRRGLNEVRDAINEQVGLICPQPNH